MRAFNSGSSGLAYGSPTITTRRPSASLKLMPSLSFPPHTHSIKAPVCVGLWTAFETEDDASPSVVSRLENRATASEKERSAVSTSAAFLGSRNTVFKRAILCVVPVCVHRVYTLSAYAKEGKNTTAPPGVTAHAFATIRPSSSIIFSSSRLPKEKSSVKPLGPTPTASGSSASRGTTWPRDKENRGFGSGVGLETRRAFRSFAAEGSAEVFATGSAAGSSASADPPRTGAQSGKSCAASSSMGLNVPPTRTTARAWSTTARNRAAASSRTNFRRPPGDLAESRSGFDADAFCSFFSTSTRPSASAAASAETKAASACTEPTRGVF